MTKSIKGLYWVTALLLAMLAAPSFAATKQFMFSITQLDPQTIRATLTNNSPVGNSNISSYTFTIQGLTITGVTDRTGRGSLPGNNGSTVSITNINPPVQGPNGTYVLDLTVSAGAFTCPNLGNVTSVTAYTGSVLTGQTFADTGGSRSAGIDCVGKALLCGDPEADNIANPGNVAPNQPGYVLAQRGIFDKNGDSCANGSQTIDYNFANALLVNNTIISAWNVSQDHNAALAYSVNGSLRPTTNGWADAVQPSVAWAENPPGKPSFILALDCLGTNPSSGNLPGPYGTLQADVDSSATTGTVLLNVPAGPLAEGWATLPAAPFPVVIGTERMQVIAVGGAASPYTLTLDTTTALTPSGSAATRAKGGTTAAQHSAGVYIMSTPLPIIPGVPPYSSAGTLAAYKPGLQAHMCVQDYGVSPYGVGTVYDYATFIDIGDGGGKIGP